MYFGMTLSQYIEIAFSYHIMKTLEQFTPELEVYSIDEAFLNMDGMPVDLTAYGRKIRNTVKQWTGIPVGVGMAQTKTLAKIANNIAKKSPKADGVLVLDKQKYINLALSITPVGDVWGIGKQYARHLNSVGVHTALQLRDMPDKWVRQHLTVVGLRTVHELRGIQAIPMELSPIAKKGITVSRAFGQKLKDKEQIKQALTPMAEHLSFRLGNQIFFVFVETVDSQFEDNAKKLFINTAQEANAIPCVMGIKKKFFGGYDIVLPGWGFRHALTSEIVNPADLVSDELIEMTDWELHDFAVQLVA